MPRHHRSTRSPRGLAILTLVLCGACTGAGQDGWTEVTDGGEGMGEPVHIVGQVHQLMVEGGVWVIQTEDGVNYNPMNVPEAFQVEGLAVEAEATPHDDMVSTGMVGPIVTLIRIRENADAMPAPGSAETSPTRQADPLTGTSWLLEELAGQAPIEGVEVTIEFPEAGAVNGSASCNTFRGSMETVGDSISLGPLATTRMACAPEQMDQEARYLQMLGQATRTRVEGPELRMYGASDEPILRFSRR